MTDGTLKPPSGALDIHLIAIGGTGMAPLACLLQEQGHRVRGSDGPLYPPMSTLLADAGIEPFVGYDPAHLDPAPDLVIVGNAIPRTNPEAEEAERLGLERRSMPEALAEFFLAGRQPLVIAGTHGKTTTTSLAACVYTDLGQDPGYLIGGVPLGLGQSFARGSSSRFIIEGDEYNASYFDRGPKFLHYRPQTLILTSAEYDHADLYPDPESLFEAYRNLVRLLPPAGLLVACGDSAMVREIADEADCRVITYGLDQSNDIAPIRPVEHGPHGSAFTVIDKGDPIELEIPLGGNHNVANALAVWTVARNDGLAAGAVADSLRSFDGVRRRMEDLGTRRGVTVVDDFAHHPTAIGETLAALRARYPDRRLVMLFEPRSLTAGRSFLFDDYLRACARVDIAFFAPIFHAGRLDVDERLDLEKLCERLEGKGVQAEITPDLDSLLLRALEVAREGDVLVTMSSGDFAAMPHRLLEGLE